jgi:integrase/recombinase XerD
MIERLGNPVNTIHSNLKVLRKMVKEAIAEDLMPQDKNPFDRIRLKVQKTFQEFLLDDELAKIEELQFAEGSMIDHHRKLYILCLYRRHTHF